MKINESAKNELKFCSSELMYPIILLIHSTAAISAKAKLIKPITLIKNDHLYLNVYPNRRLKLLCFIFQLFLFELHQTHICLIYPSLKLPRYEENYCVRLVLPIQCFAPY